MLLRVQLDLDDGTTHETEASAWIWRDRGPHGSRYVEAERLQPGDRVRTELEAPLRTVVGKRYVR